MWEAKIYAGEEGDVQEDVEEDQNNEAVKKVTKILTPRKIKIEEREWLENFSFEY